MIELGIAAKNRTVAYLSRVLKIGVKASGYNCSNTGFM